MDTALVMYYIRLFAPFSHNINFSKIQQFRSFLKTEVLSKGSESHCMFCNLPRFCFTMFELLHLDTGICHSELLRISSLLVLLGNFFSTVTTSQLSERTAGSLANTVCSEFHQLNLVFQEAGQ